MGSPAISRGAHGANSVLPLWTWPLNRPFADRGERWKRAQFTFDQTNRLKSASVGGTSSTYAYDGDGKRTSKTVGGTQTNCTYDVNATLPVLLDDGSHKYVWGLGLAFAVNTSGNPLVYHRVKAAVARTTNRAE